MKRENIWLGTLLTLLITLSVIYVVLPGDKKTISNISSTINSGQDNNNVTEVVVKESDAITAMQISRDEELEELISSTNEIINSSESSSEDKNNAYNSLKTIENIKSTEEKIESLIKEKYNYVNFVKMDNNNIEVILATTDANKTTANNIMRSIQELFEEHKYITVKFEL